MHPTERLLDLVALLLASRRPVPPRQLFELFAAEYGGTDQARDRKLSRDKAELRELGIPLEYVEPDADDDDEGGYRIDRAQLYLPDVRLTPDEKAALFVVGAAAVRAGLPLAGELAHALVKLRATQGDGEERAGPAIYAAGTRRAPVEELLMRAAAQRRLVRLTYPPQATERVVEPYTVAQRRGRFSVVGLCRLRGAVRTFHADRMASCTLVTPNAKGPEFELPHDFDATAHLPRHPWQISLHAPMRVELAFAPALSVSGPQALGLEPGEPCVTTNLDGLVSQVLALGAGASIAGPPEARARVREKLGRLVGGAS